MKDFISAVIVTIGLIVLVSFCDIRTTEQTGNGYGTQYKGDSGLIIPGDGELLADTIIEPESTPEPSQAEKTEVTEENTATQEIQTEIITKEKNNMDGMLLSFWHGVAAVLIGETIALMVACAWMKIRKGDK
jgi:hypothetical protein